ncbi:unnamed protein product [Periconia digitata]|uniref:AAA+ ATPase domain-containing protein n=1 Tax=Periconia digitata TaxID=1303443 RepID=A0A9W4UR95_9PLEO|nr:unnamed protein product [Periconia digitata]
MASAFALRPLERTVANQSLREGFRVHLSDKEFRNLRLAHGDLIRVSSLRGFCGYAVAWSFKPTNAASKPLAKVSDLLRDTFGQLALTDSIFIEKAPEAWKPLDSITVRCADLSDALKKYDSTRELKYWIGYTLVKLDILIPEGEFEIQQEGPRSNRSLRLRASVTSMEPAPDGDYALCYKPEVTRIILEGEPPSLQEPTLDTTPLEPASKTHTALQINSDGIGGLSEQITTINARLSKLTTPGSQPKHPRRNPRWTFLIHGPEGCGKSLLLDRLAECSWHKVCTINANWLAANRKELSEVLSTEVFTEAPEKEPTLVVIDRLDTLTQKSEDLVESLTQQIRKLKGTQIVVAATARSIFDVDAGLRSLFMDQMELPAPNVSQREDMLRQICAAEQITPDFDLAYFAERTHGFVGRDMEQLCDLAYHRCYYQGETGEDGEESSQTVVRTEDVEAVIDKVLPTVLKGSVLEVPKVKWADIAGVDHVRNLLEDMIVRPYKYPELDDKFGGPSSRKGVLLYGPPGCAKTTIAKAIATESNLNFLAVKGSELIKMYVGESERAIRDIFRRARAAKPCIIFFDEMDTIGKSRDSTQDSGLNVVATLLNEMDGIEALKDVFIIGATNRPDVLDSALIRPGRFDSHIHIALPNQEARRQIFEIHTRNWPLASDVDLAIVAARTEGSSGADIEGLCREVIDLAKKGYVENKEETVKMSYFEQALAEHVPHTGKEEAARYEGWRPGKSLSGF